MSKTLPPSSASRPAPSRPTSLWPIPVAALLTTAVFLLCSSLSCSHRKPLPPPTAPKTITTAKCYINVDNVLQQVELCNCRPPTCPKDKYPWQEPPGTCSLPLTTPCSIKPLPVQSVQP
jgi:hypothetical protein